MKEVNVLCKDWPFVMKLYVGITRDDSSDKASKPVRWTAGSVEFSGCSPTSSQLNNPTDVWLWYVQIIRSLWKTIVEVRDEHSDKVLRPVVAVAIVQE